MKLEAVRGPNQRQGWIILCLVKTASFTQSILLTDVKTESVDINAAKTQLKWIHSRCLCPEKTSFHYCCINRLFTTVWEYWTSGTVHCFLETSTTKYTPQHTAFFLMDTCYFWNSPKKTTLGLVYSWALCIAKIDYKVEIDSILLNTPCCWTILEKLRVTQLLIMFPINYRMQKCITVFKSPSLVSIMNKTTPVLMSYFSSINFSIIISSMLRFSKWALPCRFWTELTHPFIISSIHAYPYSPALIIFIILIPSSQAWIISSVAECRWGWLWVWIHIVRKTLWDSFTTSWLHSTSSSVVISTSSVM